MKNWTLGFRISVGFGVILLITLVLGSMSVYYMKYAEANSIKLSNEYVPEVEKANNLERNFLTLRINAAYYIFAERMKNRKIVDEIFDKLEDNLEEIKKHSDAYPDLVVLKEKYNKALSGIKGYRIGWNQMKKAFDKKESNEKKTR